MLRAIETIYNGYRFRSRLEARWAVFFDTLGISYEYEKEGYELDGMRYLPDFWLPQQQYWIEIKGQQPTEEEQETASRLAQATSHPVFIFFGNIMTPDNSYSPGDDSAYRLCPYEDTDGEVVAVWDNNYAWCECPHCGQLEIQFSGYADRIGCGCDHSHHSANDNSPRLIAAYTAARQARFEHREAPFTDETFALRQALRKAVIAAVDRVPPNALGIPAPTTLGVLVFSEMGWDLTAGGIKPQWDAVMDFIFNDPLCILPPVWYKAIHDQE